MADYDANCPFCRIISCSDQETTREVYRDAYTVAFFPTEPAILGHTLIVPYRHVKDIWSLNDEESIHLARTSVLIAHAIKAAIEPDGLNVIQSNGAAATQTVPHVHIHIIPRWTNDNIGRIWPTETNYSEDQKDISWEKIRTSIRSISILTSASTYSDEDRRKHLDYIQAIVTRMSAASTSAKTWLLPIITATYGYALAQHQQSVALLGMVAAILFMYLDVHYLQLERKFRALYDDVALHRAKVPTFSLDPSDRDNRLLANKSFLNCIRTVANQWVPGIKVWRSWSILPFYSVMLATGLFVFFYSKR